MTMAVLAGMSAGEALMAPPGLVYDMYRLWADRQGYRRETDD